MNNSLNLALIKASRNLSVDIKLVDAVYRSYWGFIKNQISQFHMKDMTEEEINAEDVNFNIPYIGKLYPNYDKIIKYRNHLKYLENAKAEKDKADRLPGVSD